jgi:uncharacterized membrane protein YbaN (DUF454 family)
MSATRGEKSWAYLYIVLGLALAVEGSIIQMISPLLFPYNLVVFFAVGAATVWLIRNERFQNWLLNKKTNFEKGRPH